MIGTLNKGDLCAYSGYLGKLYIGLFAGEGSNSLQFFRLTQSTIDRIKEGKKPYVEYISGQHVWERVVKVTEDVLDPESLSFFKIIKTL